MSISVSICVQFIVVALLSRIILSQIQHENPFPDQLVSLSQQPFRSLESFAPSRNVIPKKSIEELKDLCRICQMFTSEKPLECKTHCAKILNDKTSATKSGSDSTKKPTLGDALCAFCKKYPIYRISDICKKKLCSK